jgi:sugar phosphate isomerase/epimerase
MKMTRKQFLQTAAAVAGAMALPGTAASASPAPQRGMDEGFPASERKGPKRGVSIYSYEHEFNVSATLEDCLIEISDLATPGTKIGLEVLANAHIKNYPNPSAAWIDNWYKMLDRYDIIPVEYGHWVDTKLYSETKTIDTKEGVEMLIADIKLASRLGFTRARTKVGMQGGASMMTQTPADNFFDIIQGALETAQKHNIRMLTEIHSPTPLKGPTMDKYMDFITKENTNPWFALNIDFSVFQTQMAPQPGGQAAHAPSWMGKLPLAVPDDMIPLIPYIHCCHSKFNNMTDDCEETTIPYPEVIKVLVDHGYNGYMMSEYEGIDKLQGGAWPAVRKQHVMLKRLLGEA